MKSPRSYGEWPSDLTAASIATAGVRLSGVKGRQNAVVWWEGRPTEGGRGILVERRDGEVRDLLGPDANVRSRVHEYDGGSWTVLSDGVIAYVEAVDQHVHLVDADGDRVLTSHDDDTRFGDLVDAGASILAVRERHGIADEPVNDLVAIDRATGDVTVVASGHDFYSSPRPNDALGVVAYLAWDHPRMPWDDTELHLVGWRHGETPTDDRVVLSGVSTQQPLWRGDDLLAISDPDGWWLPVEVALDGSGCRTLVDGEHEVGLPPWVFGMCSMALVGEQLVVVEQRDGVAHLSLVEDRRLRALDVPFTEFGPIAVDGDRLLAVAWQAVVPQEIVSIGLDGSVEVVRDATGRLDPADVSVPTHVVVGDGPTAARALVYPPTSARFVGPDGAAPPLLILGHGGPTGAARGGFDRSIQFWTQRGFAVADVNYRGSTGYGRVMREALSGVWGIADVEDCIAVARHLVEAGLADADHLFIKGGSAGGYTTLCAVTFHDVFSAGASRYGIGDLEALARDTHKFESRYLDGLIGRWPEDADVYRERSPIHATDRLSTPMLVLQGADDPVVPPNQAESMVEALDARAVPHAYLPFEGESHGFRRAENIEQALEAEYVFFARIMGVEPSSELELEIHHL